MIPQAQIDAWANRFAAYRHPPNPDALRRWLGYFDDRDERLAALILNRVRLVSEDAIQGGYRESLNRIEGWNPNKAKREGRWFFAGYGRAGESGQAMLRIFREANGLGAARYQELFVSAVELPSLKLTIEDTVIFVDDFAGTGTQIVDSWPVTKELIASDARAVLILSAMTRRAQRRITEHTELQVIASVVLADNQNVFHESCIAFSPAEKGRLLRYCRLADPAWPKGFRDSGLLFVLAHRTPNNSLPILHRNKPTWRGVFPRYLGDR